VKIKPEDCSKTAFITKYGLFEFARMAFGLCNSPATYARVINLAMYMLSGCELIDTENISLSNQNTKFAGE
jgi:hypothetical protein